MGVKVDQHYHTGFTTLVELLLQQEGSLLRKTVTEAPHTGETTVAVEQIGAINAKQRSGRGAVIQLVDTPETRRWCDPVDYITDAEIIDKDDKVRMLIDPQSSYVKNAVNALGRQIDDTIIANLFASAKTGKKGETLVTFPNSQIIGVGVGGAASGMNIAKLKAVKKGFIKNQVNVKLERPTVVLTAEAHDNLLNEIQVISADFNPGDRVIENGMVTRILGMDIELCERLPLIGGYRAIPAYVKSGVHLGLWNDIETFIDEQTTMEKRPTTVYAAGTFGATRTQEGKVFQVLCAES